ncbi:MAG: CRISPR system precrRNA processing endoribonuclease RAMP protein Cas6 [Candidatus Thorarchaeota archaeon]
MMSLRFHLSSPATCDIGFSGVPLRAAFLNLLREYDGGLSDRVHGQAGVRTYAIDPFQCDSAFRTYFTQGEEYEFGVNLFRPSQFQKMIRNIAIRRNYGFRILHHDFSLKRVDLEQIPVESLMEQWLEQMPSESDKPIKMRMHFLTPTQFSSFGSDRAYLLPTPEKVFPGLLRIWKTLERGMTLMILGKYRDWITENVYVSGHRLRTVKVPLGRGRSLLGFVGNIEYSMKPSEDSLSKLTFCLAKFAEICNVGKNRSAGFGKVEVDFKMENRKKNRIGRVCNVHSAG